MKLSENWKIFIASTIVAITILFVSLSWPYISDSLWGKHPNTYVHLYGQENPYIMNLETNIIKSEITLIKSPDNTFMYNVPTPLRFFSWPYSGDTKLYTIMVKNEGDGIERGIKIDIDFTPNTIRAVEIGSNERAKIIQGGTPGSTVASFEIEKLTPNEVQDIDILIQGKDIKSINVWSEISGNINNLYVWEIKYFK